MATVPDIAGRSVGEAAAAYAAAGLRPVVLHGLTATGDCTCGEAKCNAVDPVTGERGRGRGKHPTSGGWQAGLDPDQARQVVWGSRNIGLALGHGRVVALDVDGDEGRASLARLEAQHGALPLTATSRTGGGEHQLFVVPESMNLGRVRNAVKFLPGLDVRELGGQIVVAPSLHFSGVRYEWIRTGEIAEMPAWLFEVMTQPKVRLVPPAPPPPAPRPATPGLFRPDAYARAEKWLMAYPGAVSGEAGSCKTLVAALGLVVGFELSEGDALGLLVRVHNPRCQPAWSLDELRHKVADAAKNSRGAERGYLLNADKPGWQDPIGSGGGHEAFAAESGGEGVITSEPLAPFGLVDVGEWEGELAPPAFVCKRLHLAPGRPTALVGYAGSGKTLLMADLAMAVAGPEGTLAWGSVPIERHGKVAIFDLEIGAYLTRSRITRLAHARGLSPKAWAGRLLVTSFPALALLDPQVEDKLCAALAGYTLAVFDSLAKLLQGAEENSAAVSGPIGLLAKVSERTGCTILLLQHEGKPGENPKEARFRGRGSSAIQDALASQWVVTPQDGVLKLEHGKSHWGPHQEDLVLRFADVGEKNADSGMSPGVRVESARPEDQTMADVALPSQPAAPVLSGVERAKIRILSLLGATGAMPIMQVRQRISGASTESKDKAIAELCEDGRLRRIPQGRSVLIERVDGVPVRDFPDTSLEAGKSTPGHFPGHFPGKSGGGGK